MSSEASEHPTWIPVIPTVDEVYLDSGQHMYTHSHTQCAGRPCVIHEPTEHVMVGFRMVWRWDVALFERICPHGVGHPDPDQFWYWESKDTMYKAVHGCCSEGCCSAGRPVPTPEAEAFFAALAKAKAIAEDLKGQAS